MRTFDYRSETPARSGRVSIEDRCVLVFDGVFLLRPELRAHWDLSVYVHVPPEVTLARARERDLGHFGSLIEIEHRYRERYIPGQALYRDEADPLTAADVVIDNMDPAAPIVRRGLDT